MEEENIKYILVKNNCALMVCYMAGCLAYFFTDSPDKKYYNTLDRGHFDCWTVMCSEKEDAEMILNNIKEVWNTEDHRIVYEEEDGETCINEDPKGTEIVKVQLITDGDKSKWIVCEGETSNEKE